MADLDGPRSGRQAATLLAQLDCNRIGPGLTDAEFARIEGEYGFEFGDDHRAFLAKGLPLNLPPAHAESGDRFPDRWPDWRHGNPADLRDALAWPVEGTLFDVEHNTFWYPTWGERPAALNEAMDTARQMLAQAPTMVPVYRHRYLPAGRGTWGHPVLSMYQTDIICYGADLVDYINREFSYDPPPWSEGPDPSQPCPSGQTSSDSDHLRLPQTLALHRELDSSYLAAKALTALGDVHYDSGDHAAARGAWSQALGILTDLDHPDTHQLRARIRLLAAGGPEAR